ncbi:MAG TPA: lipid A biosynthesis acyltransferase [Bacteroides sp.]|nr:lipid A biosynthesis acyltransferase [Bacteroides sp.]
MKLVGYILTYSLIWVLHLLPGRILYFFSDGLYLIAYHLAGYRKKVVFENLSRAFPEYGPGEIANTARKFYHHLCDLLLELAVSLFFNEKQALSRISFRNPELLETLYNKGKPVIGVTAHYGNWEYLATIGLLTDYRIIAAYKPLKNKYFDRFVLRSREKFGATLVPMDKIARQLMNFRRDKALALTIFLSDQRPVRSHIQYWTTFLGMDTPLYLGVEKLSRKLDTAVIFLKVRKVRRGHYEVEYELVCENPSSMKPFEITDAHVRILENLIREKPELWLWSHRRWKFTRDRSTG